MYYLKCICLSPDASSLQIDRFYLSDTRRLTTRGADYYYLIIETNTWLPAWCFKIVSEQEYIIQQLREEIYGTINMD